MIPHLELTNHQFIHKVFFKKNEGGIHTTFSLSCLFMGPKARPTPKPHATSVRNKFGKIQASTPKPWPKRRATPLSLQSSSSGLQHAAVDERANVFTFQHREQGNSDELQLILSQAFSPPPEGRVLAAVPSKPQPVTLQEDSQTAF